MNFTTTPPTTPGYFLIRQIDAKHEMLADVYVNALGSLNVSVGGTYRTLGEFKTYEWCRLVPAEEVEKAWDEGAKMHLGEDEVFLDNWNNSRAKQVAGGKL